MPQVPADNCQKVSPQKLPETINFAKEEEATLELWKERDVFQNSLRLSKGRPKFSFYDGPPFATGLPHYGHILAGTIKDVVTRYAHQTGFHVERRFGWDTHGLPVEFEIDKTLNIKGPEDVAKMGIAAYNKECRSIVMRYAEEWEKIVNRMGRWIDFQNDYKTMYPWYMESIWWIFRQLYNKGLVYQGIKVMPYSTACNTPLSNFESGQNYKDVVDPSVVISFPLLDEPGVSLLAWTTTPWTLPSNLALCANPNFEYVEVKDNASGNVYVILEAQLELVFKSPDLYTVQGKRKGTDLKGKAYEPLFPYFAHLAEKGAFKVLNDTYVTAETGTGIVHQAPYFGEDDYRCCLEAGVISRDQEVVCPIDSCGCFVEPVHDFLGKYIKDADKDIIKYLQDKKRLIVNSTTKHSYPFCWRSDTPLVYRAVPSWFIRVEEIKEQLLVSNSTTYWVPEYVKEKRFGNWLREARDWAISRNRYWGTPIPLWISEDGQEIVCVGSIAELERLTGTTVTDIHRESIDHLEIPSVRPGHPPLRRVPEVFDCWFESGSMPYAQMHYPFERRKEFDEYFPADFIAEGIDQTRGWFYTLLVISTALFGKAPFKNLIANGLVLASDGQKMSKRKKNYPDPMEVVNTYGADALRLYLINSPVVRAENLRFKQEGVRDIVKDVFLPWYNAFRFLMQNIDRYERAEKTQFVFKSETSVPINIMDKWIISFTQTMLNLVKREMHAYRLYTVVPHLIKYIDNLTNWYVRMNRTRIKGEIRNIHNCRSALNTLFSVLYTMVRTYAPFTPFLTEYMFQHLSNRLPPSKKNMDSVHYQLIPTPATELINSNIEKAVANMQTVIELGRIVRDRRTIPIKYPLREIVVIHPNGKALQEITSLQSYILEELNIKKLTITTNKSKYGVIMKAEPDHKTLGARLKGRFKEVTQAIKALSDAELQRFLVKKEIEVLGCKLEEQDLRLTYSFTDDLSKQYEAHSEGSILVLLDIILDEKMIDEGLSREVINRVQKLRKKAQLVPSDAAIAYYAFDGPVNSKDNLSKVCVEYGNVIESKTRTPLRRMSDLSANVSIIIEEMQKIKDVNMKLVLAKPQEALHEDCLDDDDDSNEELFLCENFVNVKLVGIEPRFGATSCEGTIQLDTNLPRRITNRRLREEIELVFGIYGYAYDLYVDGKKLDLKDNDNEVSVELFNRTIKVVRAGAPVPPSDTNEEDYICDYIRLRRGTLHGRCILQGRVLLENPKNNFILSDAELERLICTYYDIPSYPVTKEMRTRRYLIRKP